MFSIKISPGLTFAGILVYRPPDSASAHLSRLGDITADLSLRHANFTVLDDFNAHMDNVDCTLALQLADILGGGLNLTQLVSAPTHRAGHTLDLIFSNDSTLRVDVPQPLTWSDHWLVPFSLARSSCKHFARLAYVKRRNWRKVSPESMSPTLQNTSPSLTSDPSTDASTFNEWVIASLDTITPIKTLKLARKKPSAPWFSSELRSEKSACQKA